jgi:hypothetical protein
MFARRQACLTVCNTCPNILYSRQYLPCCTESCWMDSIIGGCAAMLSSAILHAVRYKQPLHSCTFYDRLCVFRMQVTLKAGHSIVIIRGGVSSTRGLGPTMTARGQSIGISIGILPQTLIMSRLDQLTRLGARIYFFSLFIKIIPVCGQP